MRVAIDEKDFIKYPFLKESQNFVSSFAGSPDRFLSTPDGKKALEQATARILSAVMGKQEKGIQKPEPVPTNSEGVRIAISGYALARLIVSCMKDRMVIDRLTRFEAQRAYEYLVDEEPEKKKYIAQSLGIDISTEEIPLVPYIELSAGMKEERWRLVNRDVWNGSVRVKKHEIDELMREYIRVSIHRNLPVAVPAAVCSLVADAVAEISAAEQKYLLEQFGSIDEGSFPPCINSLIRALSAGTNISHPGRFALTAFLHNIGMNTTEIINLYCRAPDFDISRTMYQVEHISGRGGTEYTAPSCAAMRTTGVCVNKDPLCEKISHPLSYYKFRKKKEKEKKSAVPASGNMLVDGNPGATHHHDKTDYRDDIGNPGRKDNGKPDQQDEKHEET